MKTSGLGGNEPNISLNLNAQAAKRQEAASSLGTSLAPKDTRPEPFVQVSNEAQSLQSLERAIHDCAEIDEARVAACRVKLNNGTLGLLSQNSEERLKSAQKISREMTQFELGLSPTSGLE